MKKLLILNFSFCLLLLLFAVTGKAQQPFFTDDADVTDHGKFHLELSNELDELQTASLPITKQNAGHATLAYGLAADLEISVTAQALTLVGANSAAARFTTGFGDTTFAFKYKFLKERENSRLPALAISGFVQFPTGNARRSLGSGVTDYGFYVAAQKTYRKKDVMRINGGYLLAGNTLNGVEGISLVKGKVVIAAASLIRKINEKLQLGAEITSAVSSSFKLSKGQLQAQAGGNYQINKKVSLDFGLIAGRFSASPRLGFQLGTSIDF